MCSSDLPSPPRSTLVAAVLISAGWPGERIVADAARNRLYVALHALRAAGFRPFLVTRRDGYLLEGVEVDPAG